MARITGSDFSSHPDRLGFKVHSANVPKCPARKYPFEVHPRAFQAELSHGEKDGSVCENCRQNL